MKLVDANEAIKKALENPKPWMRTATTAEDLYGELFALIYQPMSTGAWDEHGARGTIDEIAKALHRAGWTLVRREYTPSEIHAQREADERFLDMVRKKGDWT
jgi:hypothetical protein